MSLIGHRGFRLLWTAQSASVLGFYVSRVAVPLVAVTALQATPFEVGLLYAMQTVAFLVIGLPVGVLVERADLRRVMIHADIVRSLLLCTVPVAWWLGLLSLTQLLVVSLLISAATVFFDVANQSYLLPLVGKENLLEANAKLESSRTVAQTVGPAAGGGLADWISAANAVGVQALAYLFSGASLARIDTSTSPRMRAERSPVIPMLAAGIRYVFQDSFLRAVTACSATLNFFYAMATPLLILFLINDLALSELAVGAVMAVGGVGGLMGTLLSKRLAARFGHGRVLWLPFLICMPAGFLMPAAHAGFGGILLFSTGWFVVSAGLLIYNVAQVSMRQARCPLHLMTRMNATVRFVIWGVIPVGGGLSGVLAEVWGVRAALFLAVAGTICSVFWVLASPLRRTHRIPEMETYS